MKQLRYNTLYKDGLRSLSIHCRYRLKKVDPFPFPFAELKNVCQLKLNGIAYTPVAPFTGFDKLVMLTIISCDFEIIENLNLSKTLQSLMITSCDKLTTIDSRLDDIPYITINSCHVLSQLQFPGNCRNFALSEANFLSLASFQRSNLKSFGKCLTYLKIVCELQVAAFKLQQTFLSVNIFPLFI
jgi:hypothetical protein